NPPAPPSDRLWGRQDLDGIADRRDPGVTHLPGLHLARLEAFRDATDGGRQLPRLDADANRIPECLPPREWNLVIEFHVGQAEHHGDELLIGCLAEVDLPGDLLASIEAALRDENQEHAGRLDAAPDVLDVGTQRQAVELVAPRSIPEVLESLRQLEGDPRVVRDVDDEEVEEVAHRVSLPWASGPPRRRPST